MRILIIHNFSQIFNGEDAYVLDQCELFKNYGHKVILFSKSSKDIPENFITKLKISKGMFINDVVREEFKKLILKFRPEIVHIHNIYPLITPVVYKICRFFNLPMVQTIHNYRFFCPKSILFRNGNICELCVNKILAYPSIFYRCYHSSYLGSFIFSSSFLFYKLGNTFENINAYIFPSKFSKEYYFKNADLSLQELVNIPYFIDLKQRNNFLRPKDNYFLYVGRLSEEKGIIPLLDVFATLPQLKLVVIGDGPLKTQLQQYQKYKNIIIKKFLPREKIFGYMKNALFTVIPSLWYEVLPMVLIESFANGTPVIVPKFGSFTETVKDGKNGVFFRYNNFADLKDKILDLYKRRSSLDSMRKHAKKTYETKYTSEIHYKALMKVYDSLIKKL